jgi:transcriptional regulator with XRE-family HTH domain
MPNPTYDPDYGIMARMLRELREDAGFKQSDVATGLRRPNSFVSKYETGERRLDLIEVRRICELLGSDL